jgi:mRNA deadenylase 3'-5' endonuclease subunit Ccr4
VTQHTNYTGHFKGTLDYIFYTKSALLVTQLLDVDEEEVLRAHTALPSPQFASDHVSLLATFDWIEE